MFPHIGNDAKAMDVVDVAFSLRGSTIPGITAGTYSGCSRSGSTGSRQETHAGVHPIRGSDAGSGGLYLGARARLTLRLPRARIAQSFALAGARLDLGDGIEVGAGRLRPLVRARRPIFPVRGYGSRG